MSVDKKFRNYPLMYLREAENNSNLPNLFDNIDMILQTIVNGTEEQKKQFSGKFFFIAKTPKKNKKIGIIGDSFNIKYGVISRHYQKDPDHSLSAQNWKDLCKEIIRPFAISQYKNGFRFFVNVLINQHLLAVGIDIKKVNRNLVANAVTTAFGFDGDISKIPDLIYINKKCLNKTGVLSQRLLHLFRHLFKINKLIFICQ